jgi:hypothetical protein
MNGSLRLKEMNQGDDDYDQEDDDDDNFNGKLNQGRTHMDMGIICNPTHEYKIEVNKGDKENEEKDRERNKESLREEIQEFTVKLNSLSDDQIDDKRIIQMKIMELQEEMTNLDDEKMTEMKFWGAAGLNEDDEFDYGRDVVRDGSYEKMLILPYREMPLFTNAEWFQSFSNNELVSVSGILRSGKLSGGSIKADVKIKLKDMPSDQTTTPDDKYG